MSSSSTSANSSPVKTRSSRKARGRTPRKPKTSKQIESLKKLSVKEAIQKYIDKELKIVLPRCDDAQENGRPSSSTAAQPYNLEVVSIPFPSPASTIASRPPLLFNEVLQGFRSSPQSVPLVEWPPLVEAGLTSPELLSEVYGSRPPRTSTPNRHVDSPEPDIIIIENGVEQEMVQNAGKAGSILLNKVADKTDMNHTCDQTSHEENVPINECDLISDSEKQLLFTQELQVFDGDEESMEDHQERVIAPPLVAQAISESMNVAEIERKIPKGPSQSKSGSESRSSATAPPIPFSQLPNGYIITISDDEHDSMPSDVDEDMEVQDHQRPVTAEHDEHLSNGTAKNEQVEVDLPECLNPRPAPPPPQATISTSQPPSSSKLSASENGPLQILESTPPQSIIVPFQNGVSPLANGSPHVANNPGSTPPQSVMVPLQNGVVPLENGIHDDEEPQIVCDLQSLSLSAASVFNRPPQLPVKTMWLCCVMWDSKLLQELQFHEQMRCQLLTTYSIGKLLAECIHNEGHSWPGVAQMDWRKPYIVLNIITDIFGTCGSHPSLRVQEKSTAENKNPNIWDLIILPECKNIADEMVRRFSSGVKTTVIIWGAKQDPYPKPWRGVHGELWLKPTKKEDHILSVLIFHHENLTKQRGRFIHGPFPQSELWSGFQNPQLNYRTLMQVEMESGSYPTHLTVHVKKMYKPMVELPPPRPHSPFNSFSDAESCDEEEEEESIHQVSSHEKDENDVEFDEMDEEEWDEFVSVSRAASRAASVSSEDARDNEIKEIAERLFRKPSITSEQGQQKKESPVSTSPETHVSINNEGGDLVNGEATRPVPVTPVPIRNGDADGGNEEETANHEEAHLNATHAQDDQEEEIVYDKNGFQVLSASQRRLLFTQEFSTSDDELETDKQRGQKETRKKRNKSELEETLIIVDGCNDVSRRAGPAAVESPVVKINWGTGSKNDTSKNKQGVDCCNGNPGSSKSQVNRKILNGNGVDGIEGKKSNNEKNIPATGRTGRRQQSQHDRASASFEEETSEQYHFSEVLNQL